MLSLSRSILSTPVALIMVMFFSLSGCQSTKVLVNDCKAGDWGIIGNKDGDQGYEPRYDERRKFCADVDGAKMNTESGAQYHAGWEQGNFQYWQRLGKQDGIAAKPASHFLRQSESDDVKKNKTPPNQLAYQQGWINGNGDYWQGVGNQDGTAGLPASQENIRANEGQQIGFNRLSYLDGWQIGNKAYWARLGYLDAHEGRSDNEYRQHAATAQRNGVQLNETSYRAAWDVEIIEYRKTVAWADATQGRDVNTRRADAKKRGIKFSELEYKQMWEQRLVKYWLDAGKDDGFGQPNQLEERMANARRDNVFIISQTRDVYQRAWSEENTRYCSVDNAFDSGRHNRRMAINVCPAQEQNKVRFAWESGLQYESTLQKQRFNQAEMHRLSDRRASAESRLGHLERETKRDLENKNRVINNETVESDKKREREKRELREFLRHSARELGDFRDWDFRYDQQLQQIKRDIYLR